MFQDPSTVSEHKALISAPHLKYRPCLTVTLLTVWHLCFPKPTKWVLDTEDAPQPPTTIGLVQSLSTETAALDNGENSSTSLVPEATRKIMSAERIRKLLQISDATVIMPPHS
jgi:hypothetical protein